MNRHVFEAVENDHAEQQAENADADSVEKKFVAVDAEERDRGKIRKAKIRLTARFIPLGCEQASGRNQRKSGGG